MSFAVLKFNELKKIIYTFLTIAAIFFGLIQVGILLFGISLTTFQSLTTSVSISFLILGFLLRSFTIKNIGLAKFIEKPTIHGLWKGCLISNYKVDGKQIPPIEIYFYIKQTFLITTIKSFTSDQTSESVITALSFNKDSDTTDFYYIYKFYRIKNSENKVTFGSGHLRLSDSFEKLEGIYWTNASTQGEVELSLINRDCVNVDSYQVAKINDPQVN